MNVLVACEESQRVCAAFRARGDEAYSCDIIDCSGGHPEWHIQQDVLPLLHPNMVYCDEKPVGNYEFTTNDGQYHIIDKWDLIIAHPPCTYLTVTGNRWFNVEKYGDAAIKRMADREEAIKFFMEIANADCAHIAIENPVGIMSTHWRKPDQYIQPYMFGDPYEKKTCLWLKGLPKLVADNEVEPEPRTYYESGKSLPSWYADSWKLPKAERSRIRSQTFPNIARAFADQWGNYIEKKS